MFTAAALVLTILSTAATQPAASPTPEELKRQADEMAQLSSEIDKKFEELHPGQPRPLFTTGRAGPLTDLVGRYVAAIQSALDRSDSRVESETGSIVFTVSILPDGSVRTVLINRNSAGPRTREALLKAIELATPFEKFPEGIEKQYSEIVLTRTIGVRNDSPDSIRGGDRAYRAALLAALDTRWDRAGTPKNTRCDVEIAQLVGGVVSEVRFLNCPFDESSRRHLEEAVKSAPLPFSGFDEFLPTFRVSFCHPKTDCTVGLAK